MDRLEELRKEREELRNRLSEIREEEQSLEFEGLNLSGKYLYNDFRGLYIHVEDSWLSKRSFLGPLGEEENEIILEGETISYSSLEEIYFRWDMMDQIIEPFLRGASEFWGSWKEISKEEWIEVKKKAIETLNKSYYD